MAIQLISVGLSIMESLRNPARWLRSEPGLLSVISQERPDEMLLRAGIDRDLAGASAWLAAALESPAAGREAAELSALVKAVRSDRWPASVSGELKTLARIPGAGYPLSATDTAVLVGSDTPGGLPAGVWNAIALTGGDLSRVRNGVLDPCPQGAIAGARRRPVPEARRNWQRCLDAYQSQPLLSQARPGELEAELQALVFCEQVRRAPLVLSVRPLAEQAPATAEDKAVADEIIERHLLPRFDMAGAAVLGLYDDSHRRRLARTAAATTVALTGLAAVACAASLEIKPAAALAAAFYVLIGAGVVAYGSVWAAPWLLRLPATAAVGIIALVSILPGGLLGTPHLGWLAALAPTAAACGYLVVQARNHGVAGRSLWRAVAVAAIGAAHALMVSLIGLVVVADGGDLALTWHHPRYGHAGTVLLLATAWCLAVGVFSQILWDDRPITAPLAHLSWRSGR